MVSEVLIVDDHTITRSGMNALISDLYQGLRIREAEDAESFQQIMKSSKIDLAIMDLQMDDVDTIGLIEWVNIRFPYTYVLVFSMLPQNIYAHRVMKAGASGFLPKDAPMNEIKRALDMALSRQKYLGDGITDVLSENGGSVLNPFDRLSHREFTIMNLLLSGKPISGISRELNIKPSTAGTYRTRIFDKLKVGNLAELQRFAELNGWKKV